MKNARLKISRTSSAKFSASIPEHSHARKELYEVPGGDQIRRALFARAFACPDIIGIFARTILRKRN
eukprot:531686-Pyramimonas_sp.AAC.1